MAVALVWEQRAKAARKRTKAAKRKKREARLTTSESGGLGGKDEEYGGECDATARE